MNSAYEFDQPTRQSYVAIIIIIYKFYKTIIRQFWPFLLIFVFGGNLSKDKGFVIGIAVLASLTTIYGILSFFKYFFYIKEGELIVEKGILKKSKISIPLSRIQSVDFEQNIIHRVFKVVKLKIDTAGSGAKELDLNAIDMQFAKAFRKRVLANQEQSKINLDSLVSEEITPLPQVEKILEINIIELLKVGISANHFKSAWLIFFFLFWIYENLDDAGVDLEEYRDYIPDESIILQSLALVLALLFLFIAAAFFISLVRTVLKYFELKFIREDGRFKITSGLLNRKEVAALDDKVQMVQWSQNLLQKLMKLYELHIRQASSSEIKIKTAINVPGIRQDQIDKVNAYLFEDSKFYFETKMYISPAYFYRNTFYFSFVVLPILGLLIYAASYKLATVLLLVFIYKSIALFLESKKISACLNDEHLKIYGGQFGEKTSLFYIHKIQSLKIKQSIYQRRNQLADLTIMTAGGSIKLPYMYLDQARSIMNKCLYIVEESNKKWM